MTSVKLKPLDANTHLTMVWGQCDGAQLALNVTDILEA
jgi:hypothetical protein